MTKTDDRLREKLVKRMSDPKTIEDVLLQCGMGHGDGKNIADEIRSFIERKLPASNRKSCDRSEHYMSRFKDGWNACLKAVKEGLL